MVYMGSKSRVTKYIVPIIQQCINDNNLSVYIEPFAGGMNVVDKIKAPFRIASDKNRYLIALFQHLQYGGELLPEVSKELYSEVRANYKTKEYEDWYVGNIGFLASYNGRWFDGGYAKPGYERPNTDRDIEIIIVKQRTTFLLKCLILMMLYLKFSTTEK